MLSNCLKETLKYLNILLYIYNYIDLIFLTKYKENGFDCLEIMNIYFKNDLFLVYTIFIAAVSQKLLKEICFSQNSRLGW